jgi:hypothetical protein
MGLGPIVRRERAKKRKTGLRSKKEGGEKPAASWACGQRKRSWAERDGAGPGARKFLTFFFFGFSNIFSNQFEFKFKFGQNHTTH